jgi:N-hydroxyarylamine O-acetyltransferase
MNTEKYLRRLGIDQNGFVADAENLKSLQRRHLRRVPFENLDIHWKRPINLDIDAFFRKIVDQKRGGFCYELNGLLALMLGELGFQCKMISARVSHGDGRFGAEYDHLAILTKIGDDEFLTDAGFGDFPAEPLKFVLDLEQSDENGVFKIRKYDDDYFEVVKKADDEWRSEYIFNDAARKLPEFAAMCHFHQTSPDSHFTRGKVCSLMTETGRKTLTDKKYIETANSVKIEIDVQSEEQFNRILEREFEIRSSI